MGGGRVSKHWEGTGEMKGGEVGVGGKTDGRGGGVEDDDFYEDTIVTTALERGRLGGAGNTMVRSY